MDGQILAGLVSKSKNPADYKILPEVLSVEPISCMMRKDDPAFKKIVDAATANLYKSGQINAIYTKWFLSPIPPKGVNLNVPESDALKKAFANPTDSGDPAKYK
jgi:glutamate/aspartate transport system substrate-binding protein